MSAHLDARPSQGRANARRVSVIAGALLAVACARGSKAADSTATAAETTAMAAPAPASNDSAPMAKPDSDMQAVLDELAALHGKPIETLTAAEARKQPTPADAVKALLAKQGKSTTPPPGVTAVDRMVAGAAGQIKARVYTPTAGTKPFPVIVYYHGGGFVIATIDTYDAGARALALGAKAVVVSVEYRKGPENKFPAAHDDAFAAYKWVLTHAKEIGGDSSRIALAGESAGGNLAVATAIAVRDAKMPLPKFVLSVYPMAQPDTETASYKENAAAKPLNRPMMEWFYKQYLRAPADAMDPRINLVGANLKGLPPVMIISAQIDPLRSDGEMLEKALKSDGVTAERKLYPGVTHEFFGMGAVVAKAKDAEDAGATALADALAR